MMSNVIRIPLDGRLSASLDWKAEKKLAIQSIELGNKILWEMDLGLFKGLKHPLTSNSQYLSLVLSLEHFRDTLFKEFQAHTAGLSLYRGPIDFSSELQWDREMLGNLSEWLHDNSDFSEILTSYSQVDKNLLALFARDVGVEYFHLLANALPDSLKPCVSLDAKGEEDRLKQALLSHRECYQPIVPELVNSNLCLDSEALHAIILPSCKINRFDELEKLRVVFDDLTSKNTAYRLIPEEFFVSEWDGLDVVFVLTSALSPAGKRKLQGFCAAGGSVVSFGEKIGLPLEQSFEDLIFAKSKL